MPNISSIIKNVRNIMRQDRGVSGDAQRLEQLGWLLFLKILDDKDQELELIRDRYQSVIPAKFQWRHWAADPEGITGEELILFIDHPTDGLFAALRSLKAAARPAASRPRSRGLRRLEQLHEVGLRAAQGHQPAQRL